MPSQKHATARLEYDSQSMVSFFDIFLPSNKPIKTSKSHKSQMYFQYPETSDPGGPGYSLTSYGPPEYSSRGGLGPSSGPYRPGFDPEAREELMEGYRTQSKGYPMPPPNEYSRTSGGPMAESQESRFNRWCASVECKGPGYVSGRGDHEEYLDFCKYGPPKFGSRGQSYGSRGPLPGPFSGRPSSTYGPSGPSRPPPQYSKRPTRSSRQHTGRMTSRDPMEPTEMPLGARGMRKHVPGQTSMSPGDFGRPGDPQALFRQIGALSEMMYNQNRGGNRSMDGCRR